MVDSTFSALYEKVDSHTRNSNTQILQAVTSYDALKLHIISHLADADGYSAEYAESRAWMATADYLGNADFAVTHNRVMDFNPDPKSNNSVQTQFHKNPADIYIISDLPTLPVNKTLDYADKQGLRVYIQDHHPVAARLDKRYVNVCQNGIDGGAEGSAGMIVARKIPHLADKAIDFASKGTKVDAQFKQAAKMYRGTMNRCKVAAVAGSKADMQEDAGYNKKPYDELLNEGLIEKINHSFFGHYTKTLEKGLAEFSIFNLQYEEVSQTGAHHLAETRGGKTNIDPNVVSSFLDEYKGMIIVDPHKSRSGVNKYKFAQLKPDEQAAFQTDLKNVLGISDFISSLGFLHDGYDDDLRGKNVRMKPAARLLTQHGFDPSQTYSQLSSDGISKLKKLCHDNISTFEETDFVEEHHALIDKHQYGIIDPSFILGKQTIPELANNMTAMSKMGAGDLLTRVLDIWTFQETNLSPRQKLDVRTATAVKFHYNKSIAEHMGAIEQIVLAGNLEEVGENQHFLKLNNLLTDTSFDFIDGVDAVDTVDSPGSYRADLRTLTGVLGGLACSTRLLPEIHGTLFTGYQYGDLIKISGRINPFKDQQYHLGDLMAAGARKGITISGGGHPGAASTTMLIDKVDDFFDFVEDRGLI